MKISKGRVKKVSKGTIQWFNYEKGYGFIDNDEGGIIFVHYSAFKDKDYYQLQEGQRVNFDVKKGERSIYATNVKSVQ
jgi:CspA family cold shock protein